MRIALTGPDGNLGSAILDCCRHEIVRIDRQDWDRIDEILSSDIDVVIHAAYDLKNRICNHPTQVLDSNILCTARLLESMHHNNVKKIVFISTCAVYGESTNTNENTLCCPISINGIVKLLSEKMLADYCAANNITYKILRVFNMYGGDDNFSILSHLRNSLKNKTAFQLNNDGLSQRDFVHVSDVANIILMLIDLNYTHTCLNIGTGHATKICEIVKTVKDKYPELLIKNEYSSEAEYSRANISRLKTIVNYNFIDLQKYIANNFVI
mgnify:CR=1 FL=1